MISEITESCLVVSPLLNKSVYGGVPPAISLLLIRILPELTPAQFTGSTVGVTTKRGISLFTSCLGDTISQ